MAQMIINYRDASLDHGARPQGFLRSLAAVLAIIAMWIAALGFFHWGLNLFGCMATIAAAGLACRAVAVAFSLLHRVSWIGATAAFAIWAAVILSNQFHGQPPPSDRYFIALCVLSCVLSSIGLVFDRTPRL